MPLIKDGSLTEDPFIDASAAEDIPPGKPVIVSLEQWQARRDELVDSGEPIGVRLRSDQHPEAIVEDLERLSVVALEFPVFRDGRAYSYARTLRDRYGYAGELRAVGDVLLEQLHYMHRTGFNAFEIDSDDALGQWETAAGEFSVWYQPASDGQPSAIQRRKRGG